MRSFTLSGGSKVPKIAFGTPKNRPASATPRFPGTACYLCAREFMHRTLIASGILVSCSGLLLAQALFQKPIKVLGDPNFLGTAATPLIFDSFGPNWVEGRELNGPGGIALDTSVSPPILYIADSGNNRVLGYRYATQLVAGAQADIVIGQIDRFSNQAQNPGSGGRQTGLNHPTGLAVDSVGNLYVADTGNNRVLRFPQPFALANVQHFPSLVIGQKTLATTTANLNGLSASSLSIGGSGLGRTGIAFDPTGNLWVADTGNNRVLRFPASVLSANANFPAADLVMGQKDLSSNTAGGSRANFAGLGQPNGVSVDSLGNLYVTDQYFRTLIYNVPLITGQTANSVLGIDTSTNSTTTQLAFNNPVGVLGLTSGPIVADTGNNRVMVYAPPSSWTIASGQVSPPANAVLGQTSFTQNQANQGNGEASAATISGPADLATAQQELYVVDSSNNRVLVFNLSPTGVGSLATRVIGQLDFPFTGANLVDGKGFAFPAGYPAGAAFDTSVTPWRLYVPDTFNHRILGYKDFTHLKNGQTPDLVIGQPDFNRSSPNYPSGNATTPTASGLNLPTSIVVDSAGNLYVTDTGNSRVLRFPAPFASGVTSLEAADLVLGQSSFTSYITDATSVTLNSPVGLALTADGVNVAKPNSGWLAVADASQNRVLVFQKPFVSGMTASFVLGQPGFNTGTSSAAAAGMNSPRGVAVDPQDRVMVADTSNARVQIFDQAANLGNGAKPVLSLATNFSTPLSISVGAGGDFWVADANANRLLHFPSVINQVQNGNAPDAVLPALAPHSAVVDPYNNVLVTDGINRILYFVPPISVTNAATYSTNPLSAGTIAALFPAVPANPTLPANPIASGTASAPAGQFPIPSTLSDTQVTVAGIPTPLLFVSPGQNNIILPQSLTVNGTADLLAVRPSTGQIYGGAEVDLSAASPGLFTIGALGSGPVLAVNVQDGTINSASHPVLRGQYVILYGTGVGPVPNPPADGAAASGQPAGDLPTVLIHAPTGTTLIPANVTYSGLAPGFAGLWQINVQIPANAQSGDAVVIKVYEKDIPNLDQSSTLTTTLAIN